MGATTPLEQVTKTSFQTFGWDTSNLHGGLFATIISQRDHAQRVVGKVVSCSVSDNQNWESPFENNTDGGFLNASGVGMFMAKWEELYSSVAENKENNQLVGKVAEKTLITKLRSMQVWNGGQPRTISLTLNFHAFRDAEKEVAKPIRLLQLMNVPTLSDTPATAASKAIGEIKKGMKPEEQNKLFQKGIDMVEGLTPTIVSLEYGGFNYPDGYVIDTIDVSWDKSQIDSNGNFIDQDVQISLKSRYSLNTTDI